MFVSTISATFIPNPYCLPYGAFFGYMGAAAALILSSVGSAYGTAKAGIGLAHLGIYDPSKTMRGIIPCIMAGILAIYGLIVSVIIANSIDVLKKGGYSVYTGHSHLSAGLCCGFSSLASGFAIGIVGDAGVRAFAQQNKVFVSMLLILIFSEALGLYGLIVSLVVSSVAVSRAPDCPVPQPGQYLS